MESESTSESMYHQYVTPRKSANESAAGSKRTTKYVMEAAGSETRMRVWRNLIMVEVWSLPQI